MHSIAPYLTQLRKLDFVHDAQILSIGPSEISATGSGYEVEITTPTASKRFHAQVVPAHFNRAVASKLITDFRKLQGSWLLAAPTISNMLAEYLADNQVNYVDL